MKTQTKKLSWVARGFSYLSKKTTIAMSLLFISLVVYATINFPPELTTRGTLPDEVELCARCELNREWKFINETGCPISVRQSVIFNGPNGSETPFRFETIEVPVNDPEGETITYASMYQQLIAHTGTSGSFILTHAGVELNIGGTWGHFAYPDKPTKFCNEELPANDPCRCVQWIPDYAQRTMRIVRCICP